MVSVFEQMCKFMDVLSIFLECTNHLCQFLVSPLSNLYLSNLLSHQFRLFMHIENTNQVLLTFHHQPNWSPKLPNSFDSNLLSSLHQKLTLNNPQFPQHSSKATLPYKFDFKLASKFREQLLTIYPLSDWSDQQALY
jgi:hypothetical protein